VKTKARASNFDPIEFIMASILVILIFAISGAGYYPIADDFNRPTFAAQDAPILAAIGTIATACCGALTIFGLTKRVAPNYLMSVLMLYAAALLFSCFWARDPTSSLKLILKSSIYLYAVYVICQSLSQTMIARSLLLGILIVCAFSCALILLDPNFATTGPISGWRGAFQHKNGLASFCTFGIAGLLACRQEQKMRGWVLFAGTACALLLLGSQGKTGIAMTAVVVATTAAGLLTGLASADQRKFASLAVATIFITITIAVALVVSSSTAISFTGRTLVWDFFGPLVVDNFLYGLGGVAIADPELQVQAWRAVGQMQPHNSYIALMLNIGVAGVLFYFAFAAVVLMDASRASDPKAASLMLATLASYSAYGMIESNYGLMLSFPLMIVVVQSAFVETESTQRTGGPQYPQSNSRWQLKRALGSGTFLR
jgi:hypothetical protein